MSGFERAGRGAVDRAGAGTTSAPSTAGKRTLTESLAAPAAESLAANHFQAAIDDMADYDTAGGGAGPNWHSTAASTAHEWAHWTGDYVGDAVTSAGGGNWAAVNARIDALTVPKAGHADAAAARTALTPLVDAEIAAWRAATIARWNTLIGGTDTPGSGGRGYAAGAGVLAGHIAAIRTFKASQGW